MVLDFIEILKVIFLGIVARFMIKMFLKYVCLSC